MKTFSQFLIESADVWEKINHHDKTVGEPHKTHIDNWVGLSHDQINAGQIGGLMIPDEMEKNWQSIHKAGKPIRQALASKYGSHVIAYRGTLKGGKPSHGRVGELHSYTTDRRVAERFAGSPGKQMKVYSDREANSLQRKVENTGRAKFKGKHYIKKGDYIDIHDHQGHYVTDTLSMHDEVRSHNEYANEHNEKVTKAHARVEEVKIPVRNVVWATDRANQKELIVKKCMD